MAQKVQQQTGQSDLGKVLISLGLAGEREVLEAKAQEMRLPFVDLERVQIATDAIQALPEWIAKSHNVIPVRKEGTNLWLAMANADNVVALDDVKRASGCRTYPVVAVPSAIEEAIRRYYDPLGEQGASD